jgi:hypothetical protein
LESPWIVTRPGGRELKFFRMWRNTRVFRHILGHCVALAHQAVFLQEDGAVIVLDHDSEAGRSSRIDRPAGSIEPSKVFVHGGSTPDTSPIGQVEALPGLALGYVRLLQLFKARSRGNERQSLILAWLHRLFSGGRIIQEGIVAACHQVAGLRLEVT